jgi:uncharacterized membrane protein YgcG
MRSPALLHPLATPFRSLLVAAALLLLTAPAVLADSPILTERLTDKVGVLGPDRGDAEQAIAGLSDSAGVDLWVVFLATMDGMPGPDFAQQTYDRNGFGGNDMLVVVAIDEKRYAWAADSPGGLTADDLDLLCSNSLDTNFRNGDYTGGVIALAWGIQTSLGYPLSTAPATPLATPSRPAATPASGTTSSPSGGGGGLADGVITFLAILGVIFIGLAVVAAVRVRRMSKLPLEERDRATGDLARQANKLLVETDDALAEARQELGFAQAEFSAKDTAPFEAAIGKAEGELRQAFSLRQQLDDATPESPERRTQMYQEIIAHCQAAGTAVGQQTERVDSIRQIEKNAPDALKALEASVGALKDRLPSIKGAQKTLAGFAPSAWASVKGNAAEADKRGAFAEEQIAAGKAALAKEPPDRREAASAARSAQEAVAAADTLLDAIEQQAKALLEAQTTLDKELGAAEEEMRSAEAAAQAGKLDAQAEGKLGEARRLLEAARKEAGAAKPDPIAALKAAQNARAAADEALAGVRRATEERARKRAAFDSAQAMATASVARAGAYLNTRRGGIGTSARTRLAEATSHLQRAKGLASSDLDAATAEAQRADALADEAYGLARQDFEGVPYVGAYAAEYTSSGPSATVGGAVGGALGGALRGPGGGRGRGRKGGFGGSSWGSSGGGGFVGFGPGAPGSTKRRSGGGGW